MFKNYILTGLRNLGKQKVFSFINLIGLAFGMAGFALFALSAGTKANADRFHRNLDRLHTIVQVTPTEDKQKEIFTTAVPLPFTDDLKSRLPGIKETARMMPLGQVTISRKNDSFYQSGVFLADPEFFNLFNFPLKSGSPQTVLVEPRTAVMTEAAVLKYFGDEDPVGQVLTIGKNTDVRITGILKGIPRTSSLRFDMLISMATAPALGISLQDWNNHTTAVFVLIDKKINPDSLSDGLHAVWTSHIPDPDKRPIRTSLFPFKDMRLKGHHIQTFIATNHPTSVFIGIFIGMLLLVVVCINFINLSTARSMHRMREIGLRKVIGAGRGHLVKQFLAESLLLSFLALPLAVLLYELMHPIMASYFRDFALLDTTTRISNSIFNYPFLWKYLILAAVVTGVLSGLYPAFYLSSFRPIQALQGSTSTGRKKRRGSKILIVAQFSLAILFVALAGILKDQSAGLLKADFGFSRDQVAAVRIPPEAQSIRSLFAESVRRQAEVLSVSAAANIPLVWDSPTPVGPAGGTEDDQIQMEVYGVDYDFLQTMGLELIRGKGFKQAQTDSRSLVISENAASKLPFEDPIGKQVEFENRTGTIVGITKNFHFADIGFSTPLNILYLEENRLNYLLIKYGAAANLKELEADLNDQWRTFVPGLPFEFITLEEYFGRTFGLINRISGFLNLLGMTAVLFSCFGLLGLVSYLLERRAKEIGMRKILGASFARILWHLGREYVALVVAANVIALGLIFYGWHRVLKTGLLFLTPISASVYVSAFALTLAASALAVISRTWKVAHTNPVDALKME